MFHLLLAVIYLSFISLGLPDSLLGAAWPTMYHEFQVPVSYAGIISMIISGGTIFSSLQTDRLTRKLGTGKLTALSVATTAIALFGFSVSHSYWMLLLWAIPYGLGAGCVDASLNNYVALHYASRHMSWLHCMWGLGAASGPYIMSYALTGGHGWNMGYRYIALMQMVLTIILFFSLPLWKNPSEEGGKGEASEAKALSYREVLKISGAKQVLVMFFCYCALEQTAGLWASSYLVLTRGLSAQEAAGLASLFYVGITIGRAVSGFMTIKFTDVQMIWIGAAVITAGIAALLLPLGSGTALAGLILIGLGCAPVYPCIIHSTPVYFGADKSQAIIGMEMAFAYVGILAMPPIFGLIANHISITLYPFYLLVILAVMALMHEKLLKLTGNK